MPPSAMEAINAFRSFPAEERRALMARMIRDVVEREGRDEAIRLLVENVFPETPLMERQAETLAALARLPKDVAAALLAPFDQTTVRVEDCLPDDEVERIAAGAPG